MSSGPGWAVLLLVSVCLLVATRPANDQPPAYHETLDARLFPVDPALYPAVEFWRQIFGTYTSDQVVIHDEEHLGIVYSVVDLSDISQLNQSELQAAKERRKRVRDEMDRIKRLLLHLGGQESRDVDEAEAARVVEMFRSIPGSRSKYRAATRRVRSQTGQRDRFADAIRISGMFIDDIERILHDHNVPIAIARLPFVESMFNYKARSKVGASGAWQFTSSSARPYMRLDSAVDSRSDVLLAAEGAAKKLTAEYDVLGSWPLVLTAYNHGLYGIKRAVRQVGSTRIQDVVAKYHSRTFGFASRNFYTEFIAAVVVYEARRDLFPEVVPLPRLTFDELQPGAYVSLLDLVQLSKIELADLEELNPALSRSVFLGHLLVPPDYPLRVPSGTLDAVRQALGQLPAERRADRQLATRYTVRRGDTLGRIAQRFGLSMTTLQQANGLTRPDRIYVGQTLQIPNRGSWGPLRLPSKPVQVASSGPGGVHRVASGETLSSIAAHYGVSIGALVQANSLPSQDRIVVGQELRIPGSGGGGDSGSRIDHVVRAGETLSRIASQYGITVGALMQLNQLRSTVIRPGQVLRLPH